MTALHDLLLEWASEKGDGDWQQFRSAWDWLQSKSEPHRPSDAANKAWITGASLAALGHLEMTWDGAGSWAVAPSVITMLPDSGGRALLTGARSRLLYQPGNAEQGQRGAVADAAEELDIWIDDIPRRDGPTSVLIACSRPEDAERLASHCGIAYTYSVSEQLSAMLPPLAAYTGLWQPGRLPQGFPVERFDLESLRWLEQLTDEPDSPGLYRAKTYSAHVHVLVTATGLQLRASRDHAVFEVLRWDEHTVLAYDERRREMWVPVACRLPLQHERAAVLCSGQLPRFRRADGADGIVYVNVQPPVARRIADSLNQELAPLA